jgi:hypothetical protein
MWPAGWPLPVRALLISMNLILALSMLAAIEAP